MGGQSIAAFYIPFLLRRREVVTITCACPARYACRWRRLSAGQTVNAHLINPVPATITIAGDFKRDYIAANPFHAPSPVIVNHIATIYIERTCRTGEVVNINPSSIVIVHCGSLDYTAVAPSNFRAQNQGRQQPKYMSHDSSSFTIPCKHHQSCKIVPPEGGGVSSSCNN